MVKREKYFNSCEFSLIEYYTQIWQFQFLNGGLQCRFWKHNCALCTVTFKSIDLSHFLKYIYDFLKYNALVIWKILVQWVMQIF